MSQDAKIIALATQALALCRMKGLTLGTVESCTGGLIAAALTEIPGSSDVVLAGMVTYSNAAKSALAGVSTGLIDSHGAVSVQVAEAMATGGRVKLGVDICVSVTGVAGPGGGSAEKPVGLVWFAVATSGGVESIQRQFGDQGRSAIREKSVAFALDLITQAAGRP